MRATRRLATVLASLLIACFCRGETFRLLSKIDGSQSSPAGGCGDSWAPVISADGRYVLFASTANNLLLGSNNLPLPTTTLPVLNVFLRDRSSGATTLVSVNQTGAAGGNGNSIPVEISTNGQYALFESMASDLVNGDTNNASDIFVRDLANGITSLISVDTNGFPGNGRSRSSTMTPDGRVVAFVSGANNLVPGDTNQIDDVFVRDLGSNTTMVVSVGAVGRKDINTLGLAYSSSESPSLTPDGRLVVYSSTATNLVPAAVPTESEIYVRDLLTATNTRVSAYARTQFATTVMCYSPVISDDGRFVAYEGSRIPASGGIGPNYIFRYDMSNGQTKIVENNAVAVANPLIGTRTIDMSPDGRFIAYIAALFDVNGVIPATSCIRRWDANAIATILISGDISNKVPVGSACDFPKIDPTGRYVAFLAGPAILTSNSAVGSYHLYLRDTQTSTTRMLDTDTNGVGSPVSSLTVPRISADLRFVAFESADSALIPNDNNHDSDVFVKDLMTGSIELISMADPLFASTTPNGNSLSSGGSVSVDGHFIAFTSEADNLVANDTNGVRDVFVRDLANNSLALVSVATNGSVGNGPSSEPGMTPDGRFVVFCSLANNLTAGDANKVQDVFVRDFQNGMTTLVSVNSNGLAAGNGSSYSPSISQDGRFVLFLSGASNLTVGTFSGPENVFLRDLALGTNYALTSSGGSIASMTRDGRFVAFLAKIPGDVRSNLYVWNVAMASRSYTNPMAGISTATITPDGSKVVFWESNAAFLHVAGVVGNSDAVIGSNGGTNPVIRISANNSALTYVSIQGNAKQVYAYDLQSGTSVLISHPFNSSSGGSGVSDSPVISNNGRLVAYRSTATDLVTGGTDGLPNIFVYDRQTDVNTLASTSSSGNSSAPNRSLAPVFAPDGQTLFFSSWAGGFVENDFNHSSDVFALSLPYVLIAMESSGGATRLWWPWDSSKDFKVQYKDNLEDPTWQSLNAPITNNGLKAFYVDETSTGKNQRFYRVITF